MSDCFRNREIASWFGGLHPDTPSLFDLLADELAYLHALNVGAIEHSSWFSLAEEIKLTEVAIEDLRAKIAEKK